MRKGYLLLVLHCHLPYVRHPERPGYLEEDWLFEAVAETYVPVLLTLERLASEGVPFRLALSLSPTLVAMLDDPLLQERCVGYLERHADLAEAEVVRTRGTPFEWTARMYREHYRRVLEAYVSRRCAFLDGFRELARTGHMELLGSAATHALLPLLSTEESRRAQVAVGLAELERRFGRRPEAFWLPECAYEPGLDDLLAAFGVRAFFLDTHGVLLAAPRPPFGVFAPLRTPAGPVAFGRDVESSQQVWSAEEGYPGDPAYREFHRDLGYDAEPADFAPYVRGEPVQRPLGIKYYRVTGRVPLGDKEPYDPDAASLRVAEHAEHFVAQRTVQAERARAVLGFEPLIVAPYDGELFGHWWWEGVQFLEQVIRNVAARGELVLTTPSEQVARAEREPAARGQPAASSWGDGGYFEVWVNGSNDWVYPELGRAERAMVEAAARVPAGDRARQVALAECARLLLLAQASDWPFLMYVGTARDYAERRFRQLMDGFWRAMGQVEPGGIASGPPRQQGWADGPFPDIDGRVFCPSSQAGRGAGTDRSRRAPPG